MSIKKPTIEEMFYNKFVSEGIKQSDEINKQERELDEITLQHVANRKSGLYNYFLNIHKEHLPIYFVLILIFYTFINNIDFSTKNVFALLFTLFLIYILNDRNEKMYVGDMERIEMKLKSIYPKPRYFHHDAGIIELIYSIKAFRELSYKIFDELVLELDTFLEIEELLHNEGIDKLNRLYTLMKDKRKIILNHMHSFVYVINSDDRTYLDKYTKGLKSLQYIMNIHMNNARTFINERIENQGTMANTLYIEDDTEEVSYENDDERFDFYQ